MSKITDVAERLKWEPFNAPWGGGVQAAIVGPFRLLVGEHAHRPGRFRWGVQHRTDQSELIGQGVTGKCGVPHAKEQARLCLAYWMRRWCDSLDQATWAEITLSKGYVGYADVGPFRMQYEWGVDRDPSWKAYYRESHGMYAGGVHEGAGEAGREAAKGALKDWLERRIEEVEGHG